MNAWCHTGTKSVPTHASVAMNPVQTTTNCVPNPVPAAGMTASPGALRVGDQQRRDAGREPRIDLARDRTEPGNVEQLHAHPAA